MSTEIQVPTKGEALPISGIKIIGKDGIMKRVSLPSGEKVGNRYRPRVIHINWRTVHALIGVASHLAWKELMKEKAANIGSIIATKGVPIMKVDFARHKEYTSRIMKQLIWNLVQQYVQ